MKLLSRLALVLNLTAIITLCMLAIVNAENHRPNIIFVLADDIGISGISCYGSESFQTPHIDQLAADGIQFNYAFSTPICGPSRVCLMTGRYPFRTGGITNGSAEKVSPLKEIPFPHLLKEAGYATFATGKWPWLGHMDKLESWGFDETLLWNDRHTTDRYWNANLYDNGVKRNYPDKYGPDIMQESIFTFIDKTKETDPQKPFFAYYASALPHKPMIHTPDSRSPHISEYEKYRDMVLYMDKQVGQMRDQLEARNLLHNTLIIFSGDNGSIAEMKEEIRGNQVLGGKGQMTDGGVWVPLICYWPGIIRPGQHSDALVDFSDFFPTILELAGVPQPKESQFDGHSFAPLLRGQAFRSRDWVFFQYGKKYAVRNDRWKLNHQGVLFDLSKAPHQENPVDPATSDSASSAFRKLSKALSSLGLNTKDD